MEANQDLAESEVRRLRAVAGVQLGELRCVPRRGAPDAGVVAMRLEISRNAVGRAKVALADGLGREVRSLDTIACRISFATDEVGNDAVDWFVALAAALPRPVGGGIHDEA